VPTAVALAPLCTVAAIDLPGYGDSAKPRAFLRIDGLADALVAWMDALRLESAHWIGNSFGCQILADLALRHPDRVNRLVLQGPTVDPQARTLRQQLIGTPGESPRGWAGSRSPTIARQACDGHGRPSGWRWRTASRTSSPGLSRRPLWCVASTIPSSLSHGRST
jgi:pimeloyl-ACP methyl ester carboxylesterase